MGPGSSRFASRARSYTVLYGARNHRAGQAFAERLHSGFADTDGILYASRMTGCDCIAVFDRAAALKLQASPAIGLERVAALRNALAALSVRLVNSC